MSYSAIGKSKYDVAPPIGKRGLSANAGLTLIEVLIAMVVLLIGIYAVLKIFPAGFGIIEASRQRSVANSLAQSELERCKLLAESGNLPEAIIATKYNGEVINDYDPRYLNPVQTNYYDPTHTDPTHPQPLWEPDSVYLPRTIIGERTLIPASGPGQYPFYMLNFAPLDYLETDPANILLQVYDANPFTRTTGTPTTQQYAVDYTGSNSGVFTFDSGYNNRYFTVTYSWVNTDHGIVHTVIGESDKVEYDGSSYRFTAQAKLDMSDPTKFQMIPGSEKVYLRYDDVTPSDPVSGQYKRNPTSFMTGKISFSADDIGKAIGINYRVADWGILKEDFEIPPANSPGTQVQVAVLGGIKGPGYTNPPRQPNEQFLRYPVDMTDDPLGSTNCIIAIDLTSGQIYVDRDTQSMANLLPQVPPDLNPLINRANYRAGTFYIPNTDSVPHVVRVYYRGEKDWIVQVQKAASSYGLSTAISYNAFKWLTPTDITTPPGELDKHKILQFARPEAGKTVALSYYRDEDVNKNGDFTDAGDISRQYVTDELVNIATDGKAYFCQKGNQYVRPSANNSFTARGVSLTARAVWAGSGRSIVLDTRTFSGRKEYLNEVWLQSRANGMLTVR
jgi:prepilin-type N-terminal cleavage/methylation domain-containing protein